MTNKELKIQHLEHLLKQWLNDAPFKKDGLFFSPKQMSERIVQELENYQ